MTELNKTIVHAPLREFLTTGFQLPRTVQIIPYAYIRTTDETLAILTMNNLKVLTDFGSSFGEDMNLLDYIEKNLDLNSFGLLKQSKEYILEHGSIAYAKFLDVATGSELIYKPISPIVFLRFEFECSEDLEEIISNFSILFTKKVEGIIRTSSLTYNLVFLSINDLFYTCRGTSVKKYDERTGQIYEFDVSENGFPADDRITRIYKTNAASGEIPFDFQINRYANCCPEVIFYSDVSSTMTFSLMTFFSVSLPIMEKNEIFVSILVRNDIA